MNIIAPSNRFADQSGDQMVFHVPFHKNHEIGPLFKLIEDNEIEEIEYEDPTGSNQS